jgi:hypothetical protein
VSLDVGRARETLTQTLQAALAAAKEHGAALAAIAVEETGAWESVGERLLPRLDADVLRDVAILVGEPRLPDLLHASARAVAEAIGRRDDLRDAILDATEFEELCTRRQAIDDRVGEMRSRLKELRGRAGMLHLIDAASKGQRLKDDQLRAVRVHDELLGAIASLEPEGTRLAAIAARHHRARRDLHSIEDEAAAIADRFLASARRLMLDRLMLPTGPHHGHPEVTRASRTAVLAVAKRTVLAMLYESWVRPHGVKLLEFDQQHSGPISGFEIVTYPSSVELLCREAAVAVGAYRAAVAHIVAVSVEHPVNDWWQLLVPGVPRPPDSAFTDLGLTPLPPPSLPAATWHASDAASDKLAAAWASVQGEAPSKGSISDGDDDSANAFLEGTIAAEGAFMESDLQASDTEVFVQLPKAPSLVRYAEAHTNAGPVGLTSAEYQSIFDDVYVGGEHVADVFTGQNPFEHRRVEPAPQRQGLDVKDLTTSTFAPGSRVGRCVIKCLVGKGGMGEVYRAQLEGEHGFSRAVVLKRLSIDRDGDPGVLAAFVREAEIAARIAHPNVVQIFDLQSHGGEPFIMMEFLDGLPLNKMATRARRAGLVIPPAILARCALDAARGLHAAHSMRSDDGALVGLVHRDVSPDNLFLCQNGFTKLLDFGIARRSDLTTMTGKNELKGKIPFMSPEQILGEPLDARADLFSLGSSLYWLLTGEKAFTGENEMTTLYAVVNKPHRPMLELRGDAGVLTDVVESLLQKSRDDRPASALEVVKRLERCGAATNEETAAFLQQVEELWFPFGFA